MKVSAVGKELLMLSLHQKDHSTYQEEQLVAHDIFLYTDFIYIHVVMTVMIHDQ